MNDPTPVKRRRLSPEKRKSLILDHTADIIAREGVSALSMDGIGKEAGISKSLVYTYFDNLTVLLRMLLKRELTRLRKLQQQEAEAAETFEELVRGVTHQYLKYIEERGLIIERLQTEPSVAGANDPTDYSREEAVEYLAQLVTRNFDVPYEIAHAATDISFGLPANAGAYFLHNEMSRAEVENITVTMILGTFNALRNDHGLRFGKLERPAT